VFKHVGHVSCGTQYGKSEFRPGELVFAISSLDFEGRALLASERAWLIRIESVVMTVAM